MPPLAGSVNLTIPLATLLELAEAPGAAAGYGPLDPGTARCDLDHTIPHDDGGITCQCNLAPLCRHHHRLKQAQHWKLEQPSPGIMAWLTPAGRRYITLPSQHPT